MFYEIAYETGRMSVAMYADDEEAKKALAEQHRRASAGERGGPDGTQWSAERIRAVYVYDEHPDSYNVEQTMSADVAKKEVETLIKNLADENGVVALDQLAMEVRGLTHPMVPEADREGAFATRFRNKEDRQLDLGFLKEVEA